MVGLNIVLKRTLNIKCHLQSSINGMNSMFKAPKLFHQLIENNF